jgi:hypothetical protein
MVALMGLRVLIGRLAPHHPRPAQGITLTTPPQGQPLRAGRSAVALGFERRELGDDPKARASCTHEGHPHGEGRPPSSWASWESLRLGIETALEEVLKVTEMPPDDLRVLLPADAALLLSPRWSSLAHHRHHTMRAKLKALLNDSQRPHHASIV